MRLSFAARRHLRALQRWISAGCAVAALLIVGCWLVQTHQEVRVTQRELLVPEEARVSVIALAAWLRCTERLPFHPQVQPGELQAVQWNLVGGSGWVRHYARYVTGQGSLVLETERLGFLAGLGRPDEGVGNGLARLVLCGSLALGIAFLGISGLVLRAQGRDADHRWTMISG